MCTSLNSQQVESIDAATSPVGITIRQIRVQGKTTRDVESSASNDYTFLRRSFPAFTAENEDRQPWGPGVALTEEWGTLSDYVDAGAAALYATMNSSECGGFMFANATVLSGSKDPRISNLTWASETTCT